MGTPVTGEVPLHIADGVFAKMENARGQHGVGLAFAQDFDQMIERARSAACDDGYADGLTDAARDDEVVSGLRPVGVD